jgi:antitoxin Phd
MIVSMSKWQLQQAKARFSEFLDAALKKGPQIVTRRGVEEAVLVPMEQWRRLQIESRPSIKDLLLSDTARFGDFTVRRGAWKHRIGVDFSGSEIN